MLALFAVAPRGVSMASAQRLLCTDQRPKYRVVVGQGSELHTLRKYKSEPRGFRVDSL